MIKCVQKCLGSAEPRARDRDAFAGNQGQPGAVSRPRVFRGATCFTRNAAPSTIQRVKLACSPSGRSHETTQRRQSSQPRAVREVSRSPTGGAISRETARSTIPARVLAPGEPESASPTMVSFACNQGQPCDVSRLCISHGIQRVQCACSQWDREHETMHRKRPRSGPRSTQRVRAPSGIGSSGHPRHGGRSCSSSDLGLRASQPWLSRGSDLPRDAPLHVKLRSFQTSREPPASAEEYNCPIERR